MSCPDQTPKTACLKNGAVPVPDALPSLAKVKKKARGRRADLLTQEECRRLGEDFDGQRYAMKMAKNGVIFSVNQLLWMGNPADQRHNSLASERG